MEFNHFIHSDIIFGNDSIEQLPGLIKSYKSQVVMVIYDQGVKGAGIAQKVVEAAAKSEAKLVVFDKVLPNPTNELVEEAAILAKNEGVEAFIAVGGGSSIDLAKAVNVLMVKPSPISQYGGIGLVNSHLLPLIAIPTTAGTSSEITNVTALTDTVKVCKYVIIDNCLTPDKVLINPEFTRTMPASVTAATGMDAITHAVESYISNMASPLTRYQSLEALDIFYKNLPKAVENGQDMEAREQMLIGCVIGGYAFSNANLGLVHGIAHTLSAHFHLPHGMANAAVLPYVMKFNAPECKDEMIQMAEKIGGQVSGDREEDYLLFPQMLVGMIKELGIKTLSQQGIGREDFNMLAEEVLKEPVLNFNPRSEISKEDILSILEEAY